MIVKFQKRWNKYGEFNFRNGMEKAFISGITEIIHGMDLGRNRATERVTLR